MPARDGTGPEGRGSYTGRGLGNCNPVATANVPQDTGGGRSYPGARQGRRGFRNTSRGFGFGRCRRSR